MFLRFGCVIITFSFSLNCSADPKTGVDEPSKTDNPLHQSARHQWAQWRGPLGSGAGPHSDPPLRWSETENIRWKTPLPGKGHSTPVVWRDRLFLTTAVPYGDRVAPKPDSDPGAHDNSPVTRSHKFVVLAVNRGDGKIVWQRVVRQELPHEGGHYTGSLASASPVTDGEHVFASFGSRGLYCLDFSGNVKWERDLGDMQTKHNHGEGSSPALHGDTLIVNWDHQGQSFLVALNKHNGKQRWKVRRDEVTSWSSPLIVDHEGQTQVIVCGTRRTRGYDLADGRILWECGGLSHNIVASPVYADGVVYVGSSYETKAMLAIRLDGAKGDITGTDRVLWRRIRGTPYVPSPLLYRGSLYFLAHYQGVLSRVDAKTGEDNPYPIRLPQIRNVYASLAGAAGRVYITDLDGATIVISHDDYPKVLSHNRLHDSFSASPVLVGRELFLRGHKFLYCIAENQEKSGK